MTARTSAPLPSVVKDRLRQTYMRNLMAKLGVKTRHAAVVEARRQGIIP